MRCRRRQLDASDQRRFFHEDGGRQAKPSADPGIDSTGIMNRFVYRSFVTFADMMKHNRIYNQRTATLVRHVCLAVLVTIGGPAASSIAEETESETAPYRGQYEGEIRPIVQSLCSDCHSGKTPEANLDLNTVVVDFSDPAFDETVWHDAADQIKKGAMPPEDATQPTAEQRRQLVDWMADLLRAAEQSKRYADGRVMMRRLTRYEYQRTMRDLLGVDLDFARDLPSEPASPDGFLNDGATLEMSTSQIEAYLAAARRALGEAIVDGERPLQVRYRKSQTAVGKLPRKAEGGNVPVNPEFILDIPEFPRSGPFRLLVRAGALIPEGDAVPRLQVSLGNVPGIIHVPRKTVGTADVTAPLHAMQTFEFRGRIEDFPQPGEREFGANVNFHGMIAMLDFMDADGRELRYDDRTYSDPPAFVKDRKKNRNMLGPAGRHPAHGKPRHDIVVESVEFEAPYFVQWPPQSHVRLMTTSKKAKTDPQKVKEILQRFMPLAYRRPVGQAEIDEMLDLFSKIRPATASFVEAVRETLAAVLVSPHFLYIVEQRPGQHSDADGNDKLNDFELATRLSYFLWSTMPDDRLRELASADRLHDPDVLQQEVQRMLDDPRGNAFVEHFTDQWFDLAGLQRTAVNPDFYPDFDDGLKDAMREETRGVMREILVHDLSCTQLLRSDWTVVNRQLAMHYGLSTLPDSSRFERVTLGAGANRGGVLKHGAFLLSRSDGQRPHPIRRAVWILDRLLDSPPASPPPVVPDLDVDSPDSAGLTLKQQLERHRNRDSCRSCHEGIDPWGIPLEHYDAVGLWRETSPVRIRPPNNAKSKVSAPPAPPVDAQTILPDGTAIETADQLAEHLVREHRDDFARSTVKRLTGYALGRSLDWGDRKALQRLTADFIENDLRLRSLVVALVRSDLFAAK